jgi:hypothetical protein
LKDPESHGPRLFREELESVLRDSRKFRNALARAPFSWSVFPVKPGMTSWPPVKMNRQMLARLLPTHQISGPFFQHFPHNTPERHLIILAYQQELRFADFYRCFAASFPDVWQKMRLQGLIQQEIQHAEQLKKLADRLELENPHGI